ncbi:MAG: hypothetical protein RBR20_00920 [Desulfobacterales bacterium]|nr:hypothetical protein [Desulfobacteraceae bacterium]MDY0310660.1 hypothetical protein [Desulfobacterales bacterium]
MSSFAGLWLPVSEHGYFNRFTRKSIKMDVATKKKIEEQLRRLILKAETDENQDGGFGTSRSRGVQVIRRRKGSVARRAA